MYGTAVLLVDTARATGRSSLEDLARASLGRYGGPAVDFLVALGNFFTLIVYCQLLADFTVELLSLLMDSPDISRPPALIVVTLLLPYPLSLLSNLNSLRFTSFISVLALTSFTLFLLVQVVRVAASPSLSLGPGITPVTLTKATFLQAIPILIFSTSCHTSLLPIFAEQRDSFSVSTVRTAVRTAYTFIALIFLSVSLSGYLLFGVELSDSLLENFEGQGGLLIPIFLIFSLIVATAFPLVSFVARVALEGLVWGEREREREVRGWFIASLLYVGAVSVALVIEDTSLTLSLGGTLSTSLLSLSLPGLVYLTLVDGHTLPWMTPSPSPPLSLSLSLRRPKSLLAAGSVVAGVLVAVTGTLSPFLSPPS
jgi:amino acid permease